MSGFCSMFSQLLKLFPRTEFQALVKRTHAERHARGFTCWGQFVAMLFCQLGRAQWLREICGGPRSSEGKLKTSSARPRDQIHSGAGPGSPRSRLQPAELPTRRYRRRHRR